MSRTKEHKNMRSISALEGIMCSRWSRGGRIIWTFLSWSHKLTGMAVLSRSFQCSAYENTTSVCTNMSAQRSSSLSYLRALHDLTLCLSSWSDALTELSLVSSLECLTRLKVCNCSSVHDFSALSSLRALRSLALYDLPTLELQRQLTSPIESLTSLTELELHSGSLCTEDSLKDLSWISSLTSLRSLKLWNWCSLQDISALRSLKNLTILHIDYCFRLSDISSLASLTNLTNLSFNYNRSLSDLSPLSNLLSIEYLDLEGCRSLRDLSPLLSMTSLSRVVLGPTMSEIRPPLSQEEALQYRSIVSRFSQRRRLGELQEQSNA